ncbi:uncharacterized protein THITE_2171580 [Thermothielavioides terrestris NRRL 8126]|uniref:NADH-ubiquinone reductase complex 1 MLRQ subunit n=1 Tax=Thermothielavioides terrestris (strain ATCC 38088 / NRRL 8126) TaxID=578455 RepID=G2RHS7_THETT|nr:uncharacterized protein THITE_2171580 [Thermothielavioides terrestris NRRL 8126]AEO71389.1 hypothetical protein THITE_2171580 [Thermothielavioides terrestris NRRL 8126]
MFATRSLRMFRPTVRMMRPVPKEEQAAHTVSQRLRRLRHIPPELIPLGVVVTFGVSAAIYSSSRHLMVDKNLRLKRQNRAADAHQDHQSSEEHH